MSNYCQNCYELTEEISKLKAENIHLCEYKDELQVKLEKIKEIAENYRENCKIEGNCLDKRLCSTCYFGGGSEVCDYILDIIKNEGIQTSVIESLEKNEQTHADNQKSCENNCSTASKFRNEIYPDIDNQMHEWEQEQEKYAEMYADNYSDWI